MALYQGEDIAISLSGKELTDLTTSNFVVLIYSKSDKNFQLIIQGTDFKQDNENTDYYIYTIPYTTTKNMKGTYTLEVMLESKENDEDLNRKTRRIFIKEDALFIEQSRVKDCTVETT